MLVFECCVALLETTVLVWSDANKFTFCGAEVDVLKLLPKIGLALVGSCVSCFAEKTLYCGNVLCKPGLVEATVV